MSDKPMPWGAEALWEQLSPWLPGLSVEVVATLGSTNSALLERARGVPRRVVETPDIGQRDRVMVRRSVESAAFGRRAVDLQPCLLVAERQTGGRGRQGRSWHSEAGASLTFSLALPLARDDWSGLSLAVGVALADALDPAPPAALETNAASTPGSTPPARWPRIGLKWPNDLWLLNEAGDAAGSPGRKLGGVLIETVSSGTQGLAVIGVGLNVAPVRAEHLRSGAACLQEIEPTLTVPQALTRVALPLVMALREFEIEGFAAFTRRFTRRDLLLGRPLSTVPMGGSTGTSAGAGANAGADELLGTGQGVADDGALLVRTALGVQRVTSGEVSIKPLPLPSTAPSTVSPAASEGVSR